MKKYAFNEITFMQYIFLIHGTQVGIGVLQLPRELAESAGTDGWMAILVGWILSLGASLLIVQVMKRHPDGTLIELLDKLFGKWVAKAAAVLLAMYLGFFTLTIMFRAVLFIKAWILPLTPDYLLLILFAIPTYTVVRNGIRIQARYAQLVFFLFLWMLTAYWIPLKDSHWLYLLPFFKEGVIPVLKTAQSTVVSFLGFEVAFFLYPFLEKKHLASAGIVIANTLSMLVFVSVTVACFVFFSPEGIIRFNEPTLNILKIIEFRFIERLEIVFLSFYLFFISRVWMSYMYWTVFCTSQLLGKTDHRRHLQFFLVGLILYAMIFRLTFNRVDEWTKLYTKLGLAFAFIFPFMLWLYIRAADLVRRRSST